MGGTDVISLRFGIKIYLTLPLRLGDLIDESTEKRPTVRGGPYPSLLLAGGFFSALINDNGWNKMVSERDRIWSRVKVSSLLILGVFSLSACSQGKAIQGFQLDELLGNIGPSQEILRVIAVVAGLILLVVGGKIYRFGVALPGFLVGAGLGVWLAHQLIDSWQVAIVGLIVGGLIGAWLSLVLHDLAVFVIGSIATVYILQGLWSILDNNPPSIFLLIILGIVGGVVLLATSKHWTILLSSIIGATMLGWGIPTSIWLIFIFFLLGIIVQYGMSRATGREDSSKVTRST